MNKSDEQPGAQNAANAQDHADASKHGATGSASSKPALKPEGEPKNEPVAMGSPALDLRGQPASKDAIHLNT